MRYKENIAECFEVVVRNLSGRTLEFKREREVCQVRGKLSNIRPRPAFSIFSSIYFIGFE
jgi:hypothetical protein